MKRIRKGLALLITFVMLFTIMPIGNLSINAASYSDDWTTWSQGASDDAYMRAYGCWVVAQARLIRMLGIDTSSTFNPDVYLEWERNAGHINSGFYQVNGDVAPVDYAASKGKQLTYKGIYYSTADVWNCINNGDYGIICVSTSSSPTGSHWMLLDNEKSANTGTIYCYDSWSNSSKSRSLSLSSMSYTFYSIYTYGYNSSSTISPYLDLNGLINGEWKTNIAGYGTCDIYINGSLERDDATDFYVKYPKGTRYEIKDIKAAAGMKFCGSNVSLSGTIGDDDVSLALYFSDIIHISLDANGGTLGTTDFYLCRGLDKYYSDSACTNQITTIIPPTRKGYVFQHYYGDGSCGGTSGERYIYGASGGSGVGSFAFDLDDDITKDAKLYALWETCSHDYSSVITKEPTCTDTGIKTYTCACGDSYTEIIPACGHDYGEWTVIKEPSYTETGLKQRECKECPFVETETIPMLVYGEPVYSKWSEDYPDGVDESLVEKKPQYRKSTKDTKITTGSAPSGYSFESSRDVYGTWTNVGWTATKPTETDTLRITNTKTVTDKAAYKNYKYYHWYGWNSETNTYWGSYGNGVWKNYESTTSTEAFPAGNVYDGYQSYTKSVSGMHVNIWWLESVTDVPAVTHTEWYYQTRTHTKENTYIKWSEYSDWQDDIITENDNTRVETRTVYRYLTNSHEHTPAEAVSENVVQPTCTTAGSYDSVIYCSECNEEISRETILIPAILYGDANGDGTVSINDVILIRKYLAELDYDTMISTVEISPGADANGDGTVNINDAVLIRKYLAEYDYDTESSSVILGPQ